eukprot:6976911-Prymnesium_polylepis.1
MSLSIAVATITACVFDISSVAATALPAWGWKRRRRSSTPLRYSVLPSGERTVPSLPRGCTCAGRQRVGRQVDF